MPLKKRNIDEFNVVNAVTLDASIIIQKEPLQQTVFYSPPPASEALDRLRSWQLASHTQRCCRTLFSSNLNNLSNQGLGGLSLAEAGYSSLVSEYDLRLTNTQTLNANTLHETRIGYSWKRTEQTPLSTSPSIQVAGYFTGGGSTAGNLNDRERDLEIDDDLTFVHGKHEITMVHSR